MDKIDKAAETMIANLEKNTGKSLDQWIAIVRATGLQKHNELIKFLKTEHGFTHGFANLVAHKAKGSDAASKAETTDLVADQYKGKESLRAIYDNLIREIGKFGKDVEIAPKRAYVSLRRNKQFAILQPSTKTRMDIGLNLKGVEPVGKLEASGSFNSMCSHRIRVENKEDVDDQVIAWIKEAYSNS
jgi:predicted transport protein